MYKNVYGIVILTITILILFGLFSLFNGISTFVSYLMPSQSLSKNSSGGIQPGGEGNKRDNFFHKGISPKVKVIVRLAFEIAYYDVAVQHGCY